MLSDENLTVFDDGGIDLSLFMDEYALWFFGHFSHFYISIITFIEFLNFLHASELLTDATRSPYKGMGSYC